MELDEPDNTVGAEFFDESSGSAYETSEDESSHDEVSEELPASKTGSERGRRRNLTKDQGEEDGEGTPNRDDVETAARWASSFQALEAVDMRMPRRHSRGGKKRKAAKPPTKIRVKRLKSFYSNGYRELLNCEIQDAASNVADSDRLTESQIGSSIWTAIEKGILFSALERLGRDDVPEIAKRIGSKSQHQVQEFVNLLREEVMRRKDHRYQLVAPTDFPIAVEISDECCAILDRAGDALAAHQELAEEKVEKSKWADMWLINEDVAFEIDKKRKQVSGEGELEEVLPAANLLDLGTWIELADRIFMNAGSPKDEDNWQAIAEPGEAPAIRATAFEDFHSLAYNITKRLVSTAMFCSMSRQRAKGSRKVKQADISINDVEAAVKILGLKPDSHDYWIGVAKRCSLQVIKDEVGENDELVDMTYKEVETALRERLTRARSRSMSRARSRSRIRSEQPVTIRSDPGTSQNTDSEVGEDETDSEPDIETEAASVTDSIEEVMSSPPPPEQNTSNPEPNSTQQSPESAQDAFTEAHDMYTSQTEEIRLWDILEQVPPFEFELSPIQEKAPKPVRDELAERENWRAFVGYVSEWEAMEQPITREEFEANERRFERIVKRKAARKLQKDGDDQNREHDVEDEDGQQDDSLDEVEQDDQDEVLQVESPRPHRPAQSWDRESEASSDEGSLVSEDDEVGEEISMPE